MMKPFKSPKIVSLRSVAPLKKASKSKIYLLFDTTQFGNSDDHDYELDYAFVGAYHTKESALDAFVDRVIEQNGGDFVDDQGNLNVGYDYLEKILKDYGWKILVTTVE